MTLLRAFELWGKDPALDMVVNHADTNPRTSAYPMPEGDGLEAIARGFALITADDHQKLEWEFPMYEALYAYCQRKAAGGPLQIVRASRLHHRFQSVTRVT